MPSAGPGTWPGLRPGSLQRGGHLFQVVVANEGLAADAQHAQEERRKNDLNTQEKPHRPEEHLANFVKLPETARRPSPGDPGTSRKSRQGQNAAEKQTRLKRHSPQNAPQRHRAAVKARGVAENFCKRAARENLRPEARKESPKK